MNLQLLKFLKRKKKELNEIGEKYKNKLTETLLITNNPTKKTNIDDFMKNLYILIQELQKFIKEFNTEQNEALISEAIDLYKGRILPTTERIRNLKYSYNAVEYNDYDNTYHLKQDTYTIVQLENDVSEQKIKIIKNNY